MIVQTVTRNDLRALQPGESVTYVLPSQRKCKSVRSMAASLNHDERRGLYCSGSTKGRTITVTRNRHYSPDKEVKTMSETTEKTTTTMQGANIFAGAGGIEVFKNTEFGEIRTTAINGEPWFMGKDIATALGYSNPRKAIGDHVDEEDKHGVTIRDSIGRDQEATFINESGLYSLVMGSKLPTAKKFKHWVTHDVIPAIRKHGAYLTPQTAEQVLQDPDFIIRLATNFKEERQKRIQAEGQVLQLTAKVTELKPKADYCDLILATTNAVTITQIAADYNMSAKAMNQKLHDLGIQWKVNDQWILYSEYMDKGYTRSTTFDFEQRNGQRRTKMSTRWTQKGRLFLYDKLKAAGVLPLMEQQA